MSMSEHVRRAVREATLQLGQSATVSERLIAWIESAPDSSRPGDEDDAAQRLRAIFDLIQVGELSEEESAE